MQQIMGFLAEVSGQKSLCKAKKHGELPVNSLMMREKNLRFRLNILIYLFFKNLYDSRVRIINI